MKNAKKDVVINGVYIDPDFSLVVKTGVLSNDNYFITYYASYKGVDCLFSVDKTHGFLELEKCGL